MVAAYPRTERARGYLEGVAAASGLVMDEEMDDGADERAGSGADEGVDDASVDEAGW